VNAIRDSDALRSANESVVRRSHRRKASFPVRLYAALITAALVVWLLWSLWPPQVRVTRPTLDITPDRIVASTQLTNGTSSRRSVTVRFDFGYQVMGTESAPSRFQKIAAREIVADVEAEATQTVTCEFAHPQKPLPFLADAQIVSQR
jgi:hypothetical protein